MYLLTAPTAILNPSCEGYTGSMRLYAITDRRLLGGNEPERRARLVALARRWAANGVEYVQVREKDLEPDELRALAAEVVAAVRAESRATRVLVNGPAEVALEAGADGVHLPGDAPFSQGTEARETFARAGREATVSHACHSLKEVLAVREESQCDPLATTANTVIVYAPVFEKAVPGRKLPGLGLESLRAAVESAKNIPVFALGGVTGENSQSCVDAGAAGVAGIRMFLDADIENT